MFEQKKHFYAASILGGVIVAGVIWLICLLATFSSIPHESRTSLSKSVTLGPLSLAVATKTPQSNGTLITVQPKIGTIVVLLSGGCVGLLLAFWFTKKTQIPTNSP